MTNYYPLKRLLTVVALIILNGFTPAFAQAPNISYPTPQAYTTNSPITPLSPKNTGGAIPVNGGQQVSTFAGNGIESRADGTLTTASFWGPEFVRVDGLGNIYVIDYLNVVRKITPAGAVTTIPGSFGELEGMAIDANNNVFISDIDNSVIWEITAAGSAYVYAGTTRGYQDGPRSIAQFNAPFGLAFDSKGNLFVSDFNNRLIRKIDPSGVVSTFVGTAGTAGFNDGTGLSAQLYAPNPITTDKNDNIYLVDNDAVIRKITPAGVVSTLCQTPIYPGSNNGNPQLRSQGSIFDLATDGQGKIYGPDEVFGYLYMITPTGVLTTIAGKGVAGQNNGPLATATFNLPFGICHAGSNIFYIGDTGNFLIRKVTLTGYSIDKPPPAGLSFDQSTGIISGTPTAASPATNYTITAYNTSGSSSFVVSIAVNNAAVVLQPPNISYPSPQNYTAGKTINALSPTNTGGTVLAESYGLSTFAGSTGTGGTFGFINGITSGGAGSLYVTDGTQRVLKITPDGVLTVIAGTANTTGNTNGQGAAALFDNPGQITTDAAGNIYVADEKNNMIREVTPTGTVTTYAGTGAVGSADGPAASATFNQPSGLVFDGFGNLYVSDFNNNVIRKIAPNGTVSTFAGLSGSAGFINGAGASARFSGPRYLAIDASSNIYVSDYNNNAIRKITPAAVVSTLAGSGPAGFQNGAGNLATFNQPGGMTIDAEGDVYLADEGNFVVRKITPAGVVTTYAGSGVQGATNGYPLTSTKFADPRDMTIDADGNLYIADGGQIRKIDVSGYTIDKPLPPGLNFDTGTGIITGTPSIASPLTNYTITAYNTAGSSSFTIQINVNPAAVNAIQAPQISYLSPQVYPEFKTIAPLAPANAGGAVPATIYGQVNTFAGSGSPGSVDGVGKSASFSYPFGIAVSPSGNFFVTETVNATVRQITPQALVSTFAGTAGKNGYIDGQGSTARFGDPMGIAIDAAGNIYVADATNNVIRKITPGGAVSTFAGTGTAGKADGPALQASFNQPVGVAIDSYGNLYVVDQKNNLVRKITPGGAVSTFAGNGTPADVNGPALQASFNQPYGIAIDAAGDVYISDQNYIREINTSGIVTTFAGSGAQGTTDGVGTAASFNKPEGLAFNAAGNLYVADTGNDLIRQITPQQKVITLAGDFSGASSNEKSFDQPSGIVIDGSGNAYITEFWGGLGPNGTGGNIISQMVLTGYTIDKALPAGLVFDPKTGIISGTPVAQSPPTNYTVTAYNGGGSSSYIINISVQQDVTTSQTITFNPIPDKTYGDADFDPGATSSNNSISITYASSNTGVATIVNGEIHITGAGTSQITASQAGSDTYTAATPVMQLLTVNKAPLLITADDKTKYAGQPNPPLTYTASGFVYNENSSVLTEQPVLSTSATADSPPGDYTITVTGGQAANYNIVTLNGILTINVSTQSIVIPNAFTPNGDGINDYWDIKSIDEFPQCLVSVFARNGSLVFQSRGYPQPWDGTYKGSPLPTGTYYYVINPASGLPLLSGYVTILR